jgi:hypothetical protein
MIADEYRPPEPTVKPIDALGVLASWATFIFHIWASFIYAFTRHTFGGKYYTARFIPCVFLFWVYTCFMVPHADPLVNMVAGVAFLVQVLSHGHAANLCNRSEGLHSAFNGIPRLCRILPFSQDAVKKFFEPVLVGAVGYGISQFDMSLGVFFMVGGVMCLLDDASIRDRLREKARRIRDAEIEQDEVWATYDQYYNK